MFLLCILADSRGWGGTQQRQYGPQSHPVYRRYQVIRHHLLAEDMYFIYLFDNILIALVPYSYFNQIEWLKNGICYITSNFLKEDLIWWIWMLINTRCQQQEPGTKWQQAANVLFAHANAHNHTYTHECSLWPCKISAVSCLINRWAAVRAVGVLMMRVLAGQNNASARCEHSTAGVQWLIKLSQCVGNHYKSLTT